MPESESLLRHEHSCPKCRLSYWCDQPECRELKSLLCLDDDPQYKEDTWWWSEPIIKAYRSEHDEENDYSYSEVTH